MALILWKTCNEPPQTKIKNHNVERITEFTIIALPARERWTKNQYFSFFWIFSNKKVSISPKKGLNAE
jgi:hypothetical protein